MKKWFLISKTLAILRKLEFLHLAMHPMLILKGDHPKVDILYFYSENNHVVPISWRSRKINSVVRSTLAAKTLALTEAAEQGF